MSLETERIGLKELHGRQDTSLLSWHHKPPNVFECIRSHLECDEITTHLGETQIVIVIEPPYKGYYALTTFDDQYYWAADGQRSACHHMINVRTPINREYMFTGGKGDIATPMDRPWYRPCQKVLLMDRDKLVVIRAANAIKSIACGVMLKSPAVLAG